MLGEFKKGGDCIFKTEIRVHIYIDSHWTHYFIGDKLSKKDILSSSII